ncbi:MAG TPA: PAS domain S-box protein [Thermoanaerobaculia bacterium]|nr:PAS domain S-box protein [Thermoanaerobaculia bacterium]
MLCELHPRGDLEDIIEVMSDGVVAVDEQGRILFCNRALTELLGWSERDLAGKAFQQYFGVLPEGKGHTVAPARRKNGTRTRITVTRFGRRLFLIRDLETDSYSGAWWQLLSDAVATKSGAEFYSSLVQELTRILPVDAALVADTAAGRPGHAQTLAFSMDGRLLDSTSYPLAGGPCDGVARGEFCWYETGVATLFPHAELLTAERIESYAGAPLIDATGSTIGLLAVMSRSPFRRSRSVESILRVIAQRVTSELERQHTERALRESEETYRVLTESATDGIASVDEEGTIIFANTAMARIFGREVAELHGLNLTALMPERSRQRWDRFEKCLAALQRSGEWKTVRALGARNDGHEVLLEISLGKSSVQGKTQFTGILRDITERSEREGTLQAKTQRLELINGVLSDLDTRQPVEVIVERVVRRLNIAFPEYRVAFGTLGATGTLTMIASAGPENMPPLRGVQVDLSHVPDYMDLLSHGNVVVAEDTTSDSRLRVLTRTMNTGLARAVVDVPVDDSGTLAGILCFGSPSPHRWTTDEIETLEEIAKILSMAIHESRIEAEHRAAAEQVRRNEERYRSLIESVHAIVWRGIAGESRITFVSKEAESILGYPVAQWVSDPMFWPNHLHPHDRERALSVCRTKKGAQGSHELEYRMIAADGRTVWLRDIVHVVPDGQVFGVMIDVSERKKQEEQQGILEDAIRRAAAEWRMTFDAVQTPIIVTDSDRNVSRLNRAAAELTGRNYEFIGRPLESFDGEPWTTAARLTRTVMQTGTPASAEARDGGGQIWEVSASPSARPGESTSHVIVVMWDVTGVVDLQASLRRSEAMSAMGSLVAGVAHEVRNPLFGISATIDLFEEATGSEYAEYATVLRRELNRLARLMTDLLDYGRPQSLEMTPIDLQSLVAEAIGACHAETQKASVRIDVHHAGRLSQIPADAQRLRRVFVNLIENAVQHSPAGGDVTVHLREEEWDDRRWLRCDVADRGPGFRSEDISRVFEPFFTRRKGGTGLGLSIVHRVVEGHGGLVEASNGPSGGAIVSVRLPVKD